MAAIFLGGLESALRWGLGPPPPPVRVHSTIRAEGPWFREEQGLLSPTYQRDEPTPPFPARLEGPRIAVLGGSSVHSGSPGLRPDQEFPQVLQRLLGYPVLNLGEPGADSHDCVDLAEALGACDISALVVYVGHNDIGNMYFHSRYAGRWDAASLRILAGLEHMQLFCQLRRLVRPPEGEAFSFASARRQDPEILDPDRLQAALRHYETNLRRIVWLARERGILAVLVTPVGALTRRPVYRGCEAWACPGRDHDDAMRWRETDPTQTVALLDKAWDADQPPVRAHSSMPDIVRRVAAEEGALLVDARRDLPREKGLDVPSRFLFVDHMHFTEFGHQAMARLIERGLNRSQPVVDHEIAP